MMCVQYSSSYVSLQVAVCPSQNPNDVAPVVVDSAGNGIVKIVTTSSWYCLCVVMVTQLNACLNQVAVVVVVVVCLEQGTLLLAALLLPNG